MKFRKLCAVMLLLVVTGCGDDSPDADDLPAIDAGGGMCTMADSELLAMDLGTLDHDPFLAVCFFQASSSSTPEATFSACADNAGLTGSCASCISPVATCIFAECETECSAEGNGCPECGCQNGCFDSIATCTGFDPCAPPGDGGT